jgi:general secretion pathway protein D
MSPRSSDRNCGALSRLFPFPLDIEPEIRKATPATPNSLTPSMSERKIKSSISVASGRTVLPAGLIRETHQGNHSGIPG